MGSKRGCMEREFSYAEYSTRPRILILENEKNDVLMPGMNGSVYFMPDARHGLGFKETKIAKSEIFDLLGPTFFGLLEDLVPGSPICDTFLSEFEVFEKSSGAITINPKYGTWVYYPRDRHLVRFAPLFWHRLSLVVRNSILIRDPEMKLTWPEIREQFEKSVIAVAGASIGNNAIHAVVQDIRPDRIKIADQKEYHMSNANRVRISYRDFGRNKAVLTSEQIHSIDPFVLISVFDSGLHSGNLGDFISGNQKLREPPASVVIEEIDDLDMKVAIREEARRQKIPVVMATDLASAIQLDIRRFDRDDRLPLAGCGISDDDLYSALDECRNADIGKSRFDIFASRLIGTHYRDIPEFRKIFLNEEPPLFAGWAQLGSTAMMGGGVASEAVARIILGHKLPERMFINKFTGETIVEGERL